MLYLYFRYNWRNKQNCRKQKKFGQFYNVGNPNEEYSIKQLALMVQNLCEKTCDIKYVSRDFYGNSYEYIDKRVPDISKIENNTGWKPKIDLTTGLKILGIFDKVKNEKTTIIAEIGINHNGDVNL